MIRYAIALVVISTAATLACTSGDSTRSLTCQDVGEHMTEVVAGSIAMDAADRREATSLHTNRCQTAHYSATAMDCIMRATTARQVDGCTG
jgi:hypothetical protein